MFNTFFDVTLFEAALGASMCLALGFFVGMLFGVGLARSERA